MRTFAFPASAIAALFVVALNVSPAQAQTVLWVASNGSDMNPCQRASPCATFSRAHNAMPATGSEIKCVDSAFYGLVLTITKSVTIDCDIGVVGWITVTVAATDVVTLRGLDIQGFRLNYSDIFGLRFNGAGLLVLDKVKIRGFQGSGGALGFFPNGPAKLVMTNSTVSDNGSGGNILIKPTGGAEVQVVFDRVSVASSVFGIKADGSDQTSGQIDVDVRDTVSAHHSNNGLLAVADAGQAPIHYKITRSTAFNNGLHGAVAWGAQAFMIVSGASLTKNGTGLGQLNSSTVATYTNNDVNFNTTNVAGSITAIAQR